MTQLNVFMEPKIDYHQSVQIRNYLCATYYETFILSNSLIVPLKTMNKTGRLNQYLNINN